MPAQGALLKLEGPPVAEALYAELHAQLAGLTFVPRLHVVRLGEDPASVSYVRLKDRQAKKLGLQSEVTVLPESTSQGELLALIHQLNADQNVDGILVQFPVPKHISPKTVLEAIRPDKDVDGLHPINVGRLWSGEECLESCTPAGVMRLLNHYGFSVAGKEVVIVGRSNLVGKPLAALMLRSDATVTLAHSKTPDLVAVTRRADILVAAAGRAGLIKSSMVRPGAVVVDVGVNRVGEKLVGDVDPGVAHVAGALSPVPGGVGPMTVAMLLSNTVKAAIRRRDASAMV